jgi:hypothetical protein
MKLVLWSHDREKADFSAIIEVEAGVVEVIEGLVAIAEKAGKHNLKNQKVAEEAIFW